MTMSSSPLFDSRLTPNFFYLKIQALILARPSASVQLYPSDAIPAWRSTGKSPSRAPASSGSIENPIVLPVPRGALLMLLLPIAAWS